MKTSNLIAFVLLIVALSCKKKEEYISPDAPDCIKAKIAQLQQEPVRNPPSSVSKFRSNGQDYFYIPPFCCDQFSEFYDDKCTLICSPDGGFSGSGDGRCGDIIKNISSLKVIIWEDSRKR